MKRRFLVEMEVEVMDGHGPIGIEDLATYLESEDRAGMVQIRDVTVWKTTDDYLADLEDGHAKEITCPHLS